MRARRPAPGSVGCSSAPWALLLAERLPPPEAPPVFVNVGANKGYNLAEFISLWTPRRVDGREWFDAVARHGKAVGR